MRKDSGAKKAGKNNSSKFVNKLLKAKWAGIECSTPGSPRHNRALYLQYLCHRPPPGTHNIWEHMIRKNLLWSGA